MKSTLLPKTLVLLERLLLDAEAKMRMKSVLEVLILYALVLQVQGDHTAALAVLARALTLAEPEGYIRLFLDEDVPMMALLRQSYAHGIVPDYIATLLEVAGEPIAARPHPLSFPPGSLVEPLTERECEVLELLMDGASNREIAHFLIISVNTVKKHVLNICGKLNVQSRTQAIAKVRVLHLPQK